MQEGQKGFQKLGEISNIIKGIAKRVAIALAVLVPADIIISNDFTSPPQDSRAQGRDYSKDLDKLDPTLPIGIFGFNVDQENESGPMKMVINASRNNFKQEMHKHYGDNVVVIDGASISELREFAKQFNKKFANSNPETHFLFNHHQNTYDDKELADFMKSVKGGKRATILACGPKQEDYNVPGFDYVIIPRSDEQILGPGPSLKISPDSWNAIELMRNNSDPQEVQKGINSENNVWRVARDLILTSVYNTYEGKEVPTYKPPVVVIPSANPKGFSR